MGLVNYFMVLDDLETIFVHIKKTGGSSIEYALMTHVGQKFKTEDYGTDDCVVKTPNKHHNARRILQDLGEEKFRRYFKFSFVRNPWDRLVSYYHFICKRYHVRGGPRISTDEEIAHNSFEYFLYHKKQHNFLHISQYEQLLDTDGNMAMDFVGRFENFGEDVKKVYSFLGVDLPVYHFVRSGHRPYREYYTYVTRDYVASMCAEDIERFEYSF